MSVSPPSPSPAVPATPVAEVDVSSLRCPMTWVRTKVALARLPPGGHLVVWLGDGDMLRNVPVNARDDGHEVLSLTTAAPGRHKLELRKSLE